MTGEEMQYEFYKTLPIVDSSFDAVSRPDTSTVMMCINLSQERYFLERFMITGDMAERIKVVYSYFDEVKGCVEQIITNATAYSQILNSYNYNFSSLAGFVFPVDLLLNTTGGINTTTSGLNRCIYKSSGEFDMYIIGQNNIPILPMPIYTVRGNDIIMLIDKYTTTNRSSSLWYLRKPKYIVIGVPTIATTQTNTCELATYLHEAIVKNAIEIYLSDFKSYQKPKEQNKQ